MISENEWKAITSKSNWNHIPYSKLTPLDMNNIARVHKFRDTAIFTGFTYKAKRGFPKCPLYNFCGAEGYRPRVFLNYDFEGVPLAVELHDSKFTVDDVYDAVRKGIFESSWGRYWGGVGGLVRNYVLNSAQKDPAWRILSDEHYRIMAQGPEELARARESVLAYAQANRHISQAFTNRVTSRIEKSSNPEVALETLISLGLIINEYSTHYAENELIELVRFGFKYRSEFGLITNKDKDQIISMAKVKRVHK